MSTSILDLPSDGPVRKKVEVEESYTHSVIPYPLVQTFDDY